MGIRPQRTGSGLGVGLTLLVILGYYGLSSVARALGNTQLLAPFIAAWLPNLVIGAVGARMLASKANGFS
jgi:lipopolysaccharide export system permease protein